MPYMWWTTGFCWDGDKIKDDLTSWESLWNPAYRGKLAMLDDDREVFAVAAFRLGLDPNTTSDADLDKMLALLEEQKPLVRTYTTDHIADDDQRPGDHRPRLVGRRLPDDHRRPEREVRHPEGRRRPRLGHDGRDLSGAPHPVAANLWINFNLDAKVSAANTNYIGYMGPNAAAMEFIDKAILGRPDRQPRHRPPRQARRAPPARPRRGQVHRSAGTR